MKYIYVNEWQSCPELQRLKQLDKPPQTLYLRGHFRPDLFLKCAAVVGSRRITNYGRQVIEKLVPQLVYAGYTIISGFMYGVDQYAHQVCVDNGGQTVAVLGWGINIPLGGYEAILAERIIKNGGVLMSEWIDQKAMLWTFPVRNRIVAALADEVYVVEAALKSGSLLTAQAAEKLNRPIWAVPGPVTSKTSQGTNALIAEGKAKPWTGHQDPLPLPLISKDPILSLLENEPLTVDEVALKLNRSVADIGAHLSLLTIEGRLIEREGKYYIYAG